MASKLVVTRQKVASAVIASGETHAALIGSRLGAVLVPYLKKGEAAVDFELGIRLMMRALGGSSTTLEGADEAHAAELRDDDAPRTARDNDAAALSDILVQLREGLASLYGPDVPAQAGFTVPTPSEPVMLERVAGDVVSALATLKLPAPRFKGANINLADVAHRITAKRQSLRKHLEAVRREEREAEATLSAKTRAMASHDDLVAGASDMLSGLLRMIGERKLADRVRPARRASASQEEQAAPADGKGEGSGEEEKVA